MERFLLLCVWENKNVYSVCVVRCDGGMMEVEKQLMKILFDCFCVSVAWVMAIVYTQLGSKMICVDNKQFIYVE